MSSTKSTKSSTAVVVATKSSSPVAKSALQEQWKRGGALSPAEVALILDETKADASTAKNGDALVKAADERTDEARRVLTGLQTAAQGVRADVATSRIRLAKAILLLTTTKIRTAKSINASDLAKALDVTPGYISQVATNATAMYTLVGTGSWTPGMYTDVDAARRAKALPAMVAKALGTAEARVKSEPVGTKSTKSTTVRATSAEIKAARDVVAPAKSDAPVVVTRSVKSTKAAITRALDVLPESMTESERDALLVSLQVLVLAVQRVTVVEALQVPAAI